MRSFLTFRSRSAGNAASCRLLAGLMVLCCVQQVWAIDPNRTVSQYVSKHWGPDQGFPRGPVYAISQSPDGYLWIGTEKGLINFDGLEFREVQGERLPSFSHVLGLITDKDGSLWVRLRRPTLLRYRGGVFEDVMERLRRPHGSLATMALTKDGTPLFWLLEGEASALTLNDGRVETIPAPPGFSRSPVLAIAQTNNGDIFVGTRDAGLYRMRGGATEPVNQGLPDLKVNSLVTAANNQVWVGTDRGVVRWDGTKLTRAGVPAGLDGVQALAMAVDRDSNLWVGTNSQGLLRLNAKGVENLNLEILGSSNAVTALFEDREGDLWLGSGSGLVRLRDSAFVTYSLPEGLPADGDSPVFVDSQGTMWFGPPSGGLWWKKENGQGAVNAAGLDKDLIYSIAGVSGDLWLGRQTGGLTRLRPTRDGRFSEETFTHLDGLAQDSVYSVYEGRDGTVWAGTLSAGVSKLSAGTFTNYSVADGLVSNTINATLQTANQTMWFGTPEGLSSFLQGQWRTYTTAQGLPSDQVNCILEDSAGVLWTGGKSGLAFLRSGRFEAPGGEPVVLREEILGLVEDRFGWLWLTTPYHVLRVNRQRLLTNALRTGDVREYGLADGLRSVEGVKRDRSVVMDPAGRIWFSLHRGISRVDPSRLPASLVPAISRVRSMRVDGTPVDLSKPVHIAGNARRIAISYAGLSLAVPERVEFQYMLEPFDHGWTGPVSAREASYTNLSPGTYRFRVIASNPDGFWSSNEAAISFEVEPHFWQTLAFRASLAMACLLAVMVVYRIKLNQVTARLRAGFEERLAERTRIAQELHDTLMQGFLSASMQVHVATDRLPEDSVAKPTLTRALQRMSQMIEEARNVVRGLRSSDEAPLDLENAFLHIREEFGSGSGAGRRGEFQVSVEGTQRPLERALREEAYRIGREALINAFRHSHAQHIELKICYSTNCLRMMVQDDGCGIDPEVLESGLDGHWGLQGIRERAKRIGGRLRISSSKAGTQVELTVPGRIAFAGQNGHALAWLGRRWRWVARRQDREKGEGTEK